MISACFRLGLMVAIDRSVRGAGGSATTFLLELWEPLGQQPLDQWTNSVAEFSLASSWLAPPEAGPEGAPDRAVEARLFAVNAKGRSDAAVVQISQQQQQLLRNNSRASQPDRKGASLATTISSWTLR